MNLLPRRAPLIQRPARLGSASALRRYTMTPVPPDWKSKAPRPLPNTTTFSEQDALPRLPVPKLPDTLAKLEKTLRPLAHSPTELEAARKKINALGEPGSFGQTLHDRLVAHAADPKRANWLEEFWDDAAYLTYRDSVVVYVSYYYGFIDPPPHLPKTAANRAATIARSALLFRKALKRGEIQPDRVKDGAHCMDSWRWMFDCCRVPGLDGKDFGLTAAKAGDNGDSGSIVFIRKGRVWKVDATVNGRLLSTAELEKQVQYIYDNTTAEFPPVGYLPSNNRDVWAKDYALLYEAPRNRAVLEAIESSAFVVSLDTEKPESHVDFSKAAWHGGVKGGQLGSRWVDKPVQFVIWDNGKAAIMGEHSVMDGTPTARMSGEVVEALKSPSFDHGPTTPSTSLSAPLPLDWDVSPTVQASIDRAKSAALSLVDSQHLSFLRTSYGKKAIKAMGYSPDGYAQMVIQLAYHRLINKGNKGPTKAARIGGTYEAATTRKFQHGRTEAIRVVSEESEAFCEAMDKIDASSSADSKKQAVELFGNAIKAHGAYAKAAGNGLGVDRHMFGLRKMIRPGEEAPALFSDPLFNRSSYWVLSTSAIQHPNFDVYGWGEVVPDGYGIPYTAGQDDYLQFTLTSRKEMPNEEFSAELNRASEDIRAVITSAHAGKAKL
ncbi:carnitine acetyl transferase [Clavulina sp. PMI_390]|nr:carnitine acetyl transferase [Clavulina sp. PMI_390]